MRPAVSFLSLSKGLSDVDALVLGLLAPFPHALPWFGEVLAVCGREDRVNGIIRLLQERHLAGHFYSALRRAEQLAAVPMQAQRSLELDSLKAELFQHCAEKVALNLQEICVKKDIPCVFLKGLVSTDLYEIKHQRSVRDVDILVKKSDALTLFDQLRMGSYVLANYDSATDTLHEKKSAPVFDDNAYELPTLWTEVAIELDASDYERLLQAGRSKRFRLDANKRVFARIPIEIHFKLFPHCDIENVFDSTGTSGTGLFKLEENLELIYTFYKAYTDLCILRKPKACKLLSDVFRLLNVDGGNIDAAHLLKLSQEVGLPRAFHAVCLHAANIYMIPSIFPQSCELPHGPLDFGDILPNIFPSRWDGFELSFDTAAK